ncbi:synaptic vesicle 2-related protein [Hyposmocoma kahamanoa]|uniref:synaptic vesicle 2-related protein n=1 Tax=Hyposmocoma kahamanoa TaxID=1477025 RepID=UPI000E6D8038|nr:synaptic vesicle 2-related protein [Hyposmocoma kahamanoa]
MSPNHSLTTTRHASYDPPNIFLRDSICGLNLQIYSGKMLLFKSLGKAEQMPFRRRDEGVKSLPDIIKLLKETGPDNVPTFVAKELHKLPPVIIDHVDVTRLLKDITSLYSSLAELQCKLKASDNTVLILLMSCAFCYYGLVLMTTELFETEPDGTGDSCAADCRPLQTTDYMDLLWTTLAEFPGIFATIFVIEKFGRKKTMAAQFVIFAVCVCVLIYNGNRTFLTCVLFLARGIIAGLFQAAYVYTPEVYPTALRSTAVGACSGVARLGAMITPYVAQVLLKNSIAIATGVYSLAAVLAAIACLLLPIETKGREMRDTITGTT